MRRFEFNLDQECHVLLQDQRQQRAAAIALQFILS